MYLKVPPVHHAYMGRPPKPRLDVRGNHRLRAWRKYRKLSQEAAAERIGDWLIKHGFSESGYTYATLGRVETGKLSYTEPLLLAMAHVYRTDVSSLLDRDPDDSESLWSYWNKADPDQRERLVDIAKTLTKRN